MWTRRAHMEDRQRMGLKVSDLMIIFAGLCISPEEGLGPTRIEFAWKHGPVNRKKAQAWAFFLSVEMATRSRTRCSVLHDATAERDVRTPALGNRPGSAGAPLRKCYALSCVQGNNRLLLVALRTK